MRGGRLSSASPVAVNVTSSGVGVDVGVVVAPVVPVGVVVAGVRVTIHDPTRNCSIRNGDAVDGVVGPVGVGVVGVGVVVVCARASEAAVASDARTMMIVRMLGLP